MNEAKLEALLTNLGTVLHRALVNTSEGSRQGTADNVITVINGQLGPFLAEMIRETDALRLEVARLKGSS